MIVDDVALAQAIAFLQAMGMLPNEIFDIYGIPILNENEYKKYLALNNTEKILLNSFKSVKNAIYFIIALSFFKIKKNFVEFTHSDVINERNYLMKQYFPNHHRC